MNSVQMSVSNHLLLFPSSFRIPSAGSLVLNIVGITVCTSPQDMCFKQIGDSPSQLDCQKSISSSGYLPMIVISSLHRGRRESQRGGENSCMTQWASVP